MKPKQFVSFAVLVSTPTFPLHCKFLSTKEGEPQVCLHLGHPDGK